MVDTCSCMILMTLNCYTLVFGGGMGKFYLILSACVYCIQSTVKVASKWQVLPADKWFSSETPVKSGEKHTKFQSEWHNKF